MIDFGPELGVFPQGGQFFFPQAGAVGQLMAAWARHLGAWVIGVVSKAESVERARAAGCDEVLVFDAASLAAQVAELTAGRKGEVVYDPIGRATFEASLNS